MHVTPRSLSRRMIVNSRSASCCDRLLVGSSNTISRAPWPMADAICSICCWPMVSDATVRVTSSVTSIGASNPSARFRISRLDTKPRVDGRLPRHRFSATDRFSQNDSSWWTIATPAASAWVGLSRRTGFPSNSTRPSSGAWMPASSLPECALAGAVLPAEGVARPGGNVERDVVERDDSGESFRHVVESHGGRRGHRLAS